MSFNITGQQLAAFASHLSAANRAGLLPAINQTLDRFQISESAIRVRYFMAQASFETGGFTTWEEDLIYSTPERLIEVWPSRFSMIEDAPGKEHAPDFVDAPEKLANLVYAGRDGNGNAASGDGYAYRGRGGFDLTFHANYAAASAYLYGTPYTYLNAPDKVSQYLDGMLSAGWFWMDNKLNALADSDSFTRVTEIINGSTVTVPQRLPVLNLANKIFTW
jgi:putative chitinase